ncbi:MAG: NAD-dependent dehydratase [Actinomycetota bacterium]|nr:MAG: NAD-dependent dehydratase [Actinomycetota bacterium]
MTKRATVAGAGGFIGHHLVKYLKAEGYRVRGVDIKEPEYEPTDADEFLLLDLREFENCRKATADVDEVYQLAADMGGIGYITANHADVARNNVLINAHMLQAAHENGVERYFYSSSACIYPMYKQHEPDVTPLREEDAYPADPEEGYGWEKLYAEKLCQYFTEEGKLDTRVARFHNIYGPLGTYEGGREKAPAAICRKVALASDGDAIEIWGDGQQTRSFTYVDDCVEGIHRLMRSDYRSPLNLGTDRLITVDGLVDLVCAAAGKTLVKVHDVSKPQGVRGRNSDNTKLREVLGWEPSTSLEDGIAATYRWIESELVKAGRVRTQREAV